jgi:hypothetical protein
MVSNISIFPVKVVIIAAPALDRAGLRLAGKFDATVDGRVLVHATKQPLLEGCRVLLAEGVDPDAVAIMRHAGSSTDALRAKLGAAAKVTVAERDRGGVRFEHWQPLARHSFDVEPVLRTRQPPVVLYAPNTGAR